MAPALLGLTQGLFQQVSERRADVCLFELHEKDDSIEGSPLAFQYFPESMTDSKAVNYQQKEIPGGSLPLYQWVSSGERLLSFTAMFTTDMNVIEAPEAIQQGVYGDRRSLDVRAAILWLRRFQMPRYTATGSGPITSTLQNANATPQHRTFAPRKLRLFIPNSGIGLAGGGRSAADISDDAVNCVMTQCEVTYQSWFPNGLPQIAEVQLSFAEVPQVGGRVYFPGASQEIDTLVREGGNGEDATEFFAYGIKPRRLT